MRAICYDFLKYFLLSFTLVLVSCGEKKTSASKESAVLEKTESKKSNWVSIFNGKDLEGWTMKIKGYPLGENFGNTFRVSDGILSIRYDGYGPDLKGRFGTLYFDKRLTDYRLKVEYRFVGETAPGAPEWGYRDSGIQFHGQPPNTQKLNQPFPVCMEYNFHGGNGKDDRPLGALCVNGIFVEFDGAKNTTTCIPATVPRTFHGDQWVTAEIDIKDGEIIHFVNGEEILSYTNPTYDPNNETAKTLIVDGDTSVKGGYLSFQSNSHPIDFRKIELLEY
ncbi:3-keto-disaccharide hydrolase [Ulvibacterium sp.]|uniref:3-keto-disaccharide hydrolase n=1 Tax=Ulvibacterium sp. TaxID=2665914 RepID=UPI003CC53388